MRIAIIDLGTNTFNLLIAEINPDKTYQILFNEKQGVKLGKGGINHRYIQPDAFQRGINALEIHNQNILKFHAEKVYAIGTSALRDASNTAEFKEEVKKRFGIEIRIISGDEEAGYIYLGVRQSLPFGDEKIIMLDIGGGSNEFIIANKTQVFWKYSFNLGMSRLLDQFAPSDPITVQEIQKIEKYLSSEMQPLFEAVNTHKPSVLIGASGTFDTFRSMLRSGNFDFFKDQPSMEMDLKDYKLLHQRLVNSTLEERKLMPGLEPVRIEMIVLASIFVNFSLKKLKIKKMFQSSYSLKEGILAEVTEIALSNTIQN
jgi:exopolyphosphatase / guanosine-5'-triphosphate,3'-diphosphate pyrophosphatase